MDDRVQELVEAAIAALAHAHAPYSNFRVGAALLDSDGAIHSGCNVENSSYGLTICAERTAVFKAISTGKTSFRGIAVVCDRETLPYPCGACRQVLAEFCDAEMPVVVASAKSPNLQEHFQLEELLPKSFRME
jgi:cytidine deaminase